MISRGVKVVKIVSVKRITTTIEYTVLEVTSSAESYIVQDSIELAQAKHDWINAKADETFEVKVIEDKSGKTI